MREFDENTEYQQIKVNPEIVIDKFKPGQNTVIIDLDRSV